MVKESSVKMMLGFNKEEGMEDLKLEPKLYYNHLLEVWHLFY
jgi:hypothetical protein